jgi:O-antigen ligase
MTTTLDAHAPIADPHAPPALPAGSRSRHRTMGEGWPLVALLGLYPLWWALGIGAFAFVLFAVPMVWYLATHRPLRLPPGFGFWLLFLCWTFASLVMLPYSPPGTMAGTVSGRLIGIAFNMAAYLAATITLLYVVNLPRQAVSQRRLLTLLSALFVYTVAGGLLGVLAPHFGFVSPLESVLPASIRDNQYVQVLVHPTSAQVQDVLGYETPRPAAPFGYTNWWGNNFSILLVWFVVMLWPTRSRWRRTLAVVLCAVALVPVVYSLDRALWVGLGITVVYLVVRLALRGDLRAAITMLVAVPIALSVFTLTPLHDIVQARAQHPQSNDVRSFLSKAAIDGAEHSPVLGYGGVRRTLGSNRSISIGPTAKCPLCGNFPVGSNGQFWLVLFSQGFVGAALYIGFFLTAAWAFWRDRTPIGMGGTLIVLLGLFYMFFYNSLPAAMTLSMLSIGLAVRNAWARDPATGTPLGPNPGAGRRPAVPVASGG